MAYGFCRTARIMIHKGKVVHFHGRRRRDHNFFGYGDAIRASLARRLPKRPVWALDVGTGFGRNAVFLAHNLPRGSHIWSVDPAEESLRRGEEAILKAGLAAQVSLGPGAGENLPFADREFHLTMGVMLFLPPGRGGAGSSRNGAGDPARREAASRGLGPDGASSALRH